MDDILDRAIALKNRFEHLTKLPIEESSINVAGEEIQILSKTNWVRIAVIRRSEGEKAILVEVEVSIPSGESNRNAGIGIPAIEILTGMTMHLRYLKALVECNFTLNVIRDDCLWVASRRFLDTPSLEIFKALISNRERE
ncbi:MAG: hypothetical protein ACXADC_16330 [Candidatus Thorarchaeota archaeon]|jgi:hypothetical protein